MSVAATVAPDWTQPGCGPCCRSYRVMLVGLGGWQSLVAHDPTSHEAYGRRLSEALHRSRPADPVTIDGVTIDPWRLIVSIDGAVVPLTATELRIVMALAALPGRTYTTDELLAHIWGTWRTAIRPSRAGRSNHILRSNICRIREKLGKRRDLIETIAGIGWRLVVSP
jgi:DNA-binding response OmpR family regulator